MGVSAVKPSACTMLIRRQFMLDNDLQFQRGIYSEDIEWFLRLVRHQANYDYLPLAFYMYRKNRTGSITNSIGRTNVEHLLATVLGSARGVLESDAPPAFKSDYLSYCFYQFTIALAFYGGLPHNDRQELHPALKEAEFLIAYDQYGKGQAVARMVRLLGLRATAWMLHSYLQLRAVRARWRR